jgi:UDP-N-acetylglucosamine/UDP-N-acetyl-alpha-D-glucosaminouronate 4-epimerase
MGIVLPKNEEQLPNPISPYAVSKLTGEYYCRVFTELYGLETVSLRYFNVYGPRQDPSSHYATVIPRFIRWAMLKESLEVHGDGLQSRDFTYIDNVVSANLLAAQCRDGIGEAFNVGQGSAHTLLDLANLLQDILGMNVRLLHTRSRPGDVRHTLADISKAERCLGYRPRVSFEEGIVRTVRHFTEARQRILECIA